MTNFLVEPFDERTKQAGQAIAVILGIWLAAALYLGYRGAFAVDGPSLTLPAFTLGPVVIYLLAYTLSSDLRHFVRSIDIRILVLIHAVRTVGIGFLFLYVYDVLPGLFAWPAALGDAFTAIAALLIGAALFLNADIPRRYIWRWNMFGLLDFAVAVGIGLALRSNMYGGAVTTDAMGTLPLVLFPAFAVPLMIIVHVMIFQRLNSAARTASNKLNGTADAAI